MIFTAMAVLAFSAVSVANTIEVKEEVVVNNELSANKATTPAIEVKEEVVVNNESKVEKAVVQDDDYNCYGFAMAMTDMTNLSPVATHDFYQAMLSLCLYFF